jgi:hypothetical protein
MLLDAMALMTGHRNQIVNPGLFDAHEWRDKVDAPVLANLSVLNQIRQGAKLASKIEELTSKLQKRKREAVAGSGGSGSGGGGPFSGEPPAKKARRDGKSFACYNCGKVGHRSKHCPEAATEDTLRARVSASGGGSGSNKGFGGGGRLAGRLGRHPEQ